MKQLIEYIVSNIVNHPENVVVTETEVEPSVTKYLIEVNPEDVGRVIGKQGKVIKAIRQIVRIAAIQKGVRAIVDLKEEGREYSNEAEGAVETEETPEEAPVEETPTEEEAPAEEAPEEAPAEEAPAEAKETPEETPVEEEKAEK